MCMADIAKARRKEFIEEEIAVLAKEMKKHLFIWQSKMSTQ